jgi:hypothetical protein
MYLGRPTKSIPLMDRTLPIKLARMDEARQGVAPSERTHELTNDSRDRDDPNAVFFNEIDIDRPSATVGDMLLRL